MQLCQSQNCHHGRPGRDLSPHRTGSLILPPTILPRTPSVPATPASWPSLQLCKHCLASRPLILPFLLPRILFPQIAAGLHPMSPSVLVQRSSQQKGCPRLPCDLYLPHPVLSCPNISHHQIRYTRLFIRLWSVCHLRE